MNLQKITIFSLLNTDLRKPHSKSQKVDITKKAQF